MRCEFKEGCTGWLNHALLDSCHFDDLETVLPRLPRPRFLCAQRRREFDSRHRGPSRGIQIYLADAEKFGLKIRHGSSAISMRTSWPATWSCAIIHLGAWICATQSSMPRPTSRGPSRMGERAHRGQPQPLPQPFAGAHRRNSQRPSHHSPQRGRLSLINRRQYPAADLPVVSGA